jgi:hypothetical protein
MLLETLTSNELLSFVNELLSCNNELLSFVNELLSFVTGAAGFSESLTPPLLLSKHPGETPLVVLLVPLKPIYMSIYMSIYHPIYIHVYIPPKNVYTYL